MHLKRGRAHMSWTALLLMYVATGAAAQASPRSACAVREVERWTTRFEDGSHVYVEPTDLVPLNGRMLLAGTPTYVMPPHATGLQAEHARNAIAGIMIDADRGVTAVPWPLQGRHLKVLRSARERTGGWLVLLAELDAPAHIPDTPHMIGLWQALWDGERWTDARSIPMPPRTGLRIVNNSSVVPFGDGYAWALSFREADGESGGVVLFREGGEFRWEVIESPNTSYVELLARGDALSAAIVATDPSRHPDLNSLYRFDRAETWRNAALLEPSGGFDVHKPRMMRSADRTLVAVERNVYPDWRAETLDPFVTHPPATIDSTMSYFAGVDLPGFGPMWVTEHVAPDDGRTLRFTLVEPDHLRSLGEVAGAYKGHFAAARTGTASFRLAGPRFDESGAEVALVTLILGWTIDCDRT